jgi:hypothetical protein
VTDAPAPDSVVDQWLTLPDVAERLHTEVSRVRKLLQEGKLVAVRRGDPAVASVPAAFLVPGHLANPADRRPTEGAPEWAVLASLAGTLTVLADTGFAPDEAITWLFTFDDSLQGTPIEALRAGRKSEVRRRAQAEL